MERLKGRVICFEQIVLKLIRVEGFDAVRDRLASGATCDQVLRSAFGSGPLMAQATVIEALEAYSRDLREHPSGLLATI
ncbi:MAG: hypothetical protein IRZ16_14125 [Myxococcaceae bacterium]|nr:hypothetical protein [Myxococcaceae bacterium]